MQIAQDVFSAASSSLTTKAGSLRHFARFGAVVVGISSGIIAVSNQVGAREAAYKAALAERDQEIATLKSTNNKLQMEKSGVVEKQSSGDPVQDWIDALAE